MPRATLRDSKNKPCLKDADLRSLEIAIDRAMNDMDIIGCGFIVFKRLSRKAGIEIRHVPWHQLDNYLMDIGAKGNLGGIDR